MRTCGVCSDELAADDPTERCDCGPAERCEEHARHDGGSERRNVLCGVADALAGWRHSVRPSADGEMKVTTSEGEAGGLPRSGAGRLISSRRQRQLGVLRIWDRRHGKIVVLVSSARELRCRVFLGVATRRGAMWQPPHWATEAKSQTVALELRRGDDVVKTISLAGRKSYVLGRQGDIVVEDAGASRQHAAIVHRDGAAYLFDLKSAKGVALRGAQLKPMEPAKLADGDAFVLGENPLRYVIRGLAPAGAPPPPPPPPPPPAWEPPAWAVVPTGPVRFRLERGGEAIQELELSRKKAYVLGRNKQQCDVAVPHDSVSRQHAAVIQGAQGADGGPSLHVIDFKSTKGTFVDQGAGWKRLPPNVPTLRRRAAPSACECSTVPGTSSPRPSPRRRRRRPRTRTRRGLARWFSRLCSPAPASAAGRGRRPRAGARHLRQRDRRAGGRGGGGGGGGGGRGEEEDEDDEEEETGFSNSDFRNALAPFMAARRAARRRRRQEEEEEEEEARPRRRLRRLDGEPAAPLVLEKEAAGPPASSSASRRRPRRRRRAAAAAG